MVGRKNGRPCARHIDFVKQLSPSKSASHITQQVMVGFEILGPRGTGIPKTVSLAPGPFDVRHRQDEIEARMTNSEARSPGTDHLGLLRPDIGESIANGPGQQAHPVLLMLIGRQITLKGTDLRVQMCQRIGLSDIIWIMIKPLTLLWHAFHQAHSPS